MQFIQDEGMVTTLQRKLAPPLVTLLGAEPELQYVVRDCSPVGLQAYALCTAWRACCCKAGMRPTAGARLLLLTCKINGVPAGHTLQALRNISLIIQAHPAVLANDVKVRVRSCVQAGMGHRMMQPKGMQRTLLEMLFACHKLFPRLFLPAGLLLQVQRPQL